MVLKAFKFRCYPTVKQASALTIQFGHARFIYNWALAGRREQYKTTQTGISGHTLKVGIPLLKKQPEYAWLADADSQVLQAKIDDLDRAYENFFKKRARFPKFKKKHSRQSIRYPQRFKIDGTHIYLPKIGWVKAVFHRAIEGEMRSCTVSKTKSGAYYVSILCAMTDVSIPLHFGPAVGIDLGLKSFAKLSTGETIAHPQYLRQAERRLKRLQRRLSVKKKGSQNRSKARLRFARQAEHVARQREDFLHKLSHRLVTDYALIKLETLNVCGMLKNHTLAKSISDSGWGMFGRFCEDKAPWIGSTVEHIDRFFPSSKRCHVCGYLYQRLELHHRFWTCPQCHTEHDRDDNASQNILVAPTAGAAGRHTPGDIGSDAVVVAPRRTGGRTRKPTGFSRG